MKWNTGNLITSVNGYIVTPIFTLFLFYKQTINAKIFFLHNRLNTSYVFSKNNKNNFITINQDKWYFPPNLNPSKLILQVPAMQIFPFLISVSKIYQIHFDIC